MKMLVVGLSFLSALVFGASSHAALLNLQSTNVSPTVWKVAGPSASMPADGAFVTASIMNPTPDGYGSLFGTVGGVQQGWISNNTNGLANTPVGTYYFRQEFTNALPSQIVSIKFDMLHDNNAVVLFNGSTVYTSPELTGYQLPGDTVSFSAAALVGVNKLDFILQNTASLGSINPVGLSVKFDAQNTQINPIPEPASLALWGSLTTLGLVGARRRRK
jgi:hypothetical protein